MKSYFLITLIQYTRLLSSEQFVGPSECQGRLPVEAVSEDGCVCACVCVCVRVLGMPESATPRAEQGVMCLCDDASHIGVSANIAKYCTSMSNATDEKTQCSVLALRQNKNPKEPLHNHPSVWECTPPWEYTRHACIQGR